MWMVESLTIHKQKNPKFLSQEIHLAPAAAQKSGNIVTGMLDPDFFWLKKHYMLATLFSDFHISL